MLTSKYSHKEWAQSLLAQKTSIQKRRAEANGYSHCGCSGGSGGSDRKQQPKIATNGLGTPQVMSSGICCYSV